MSVWWLAQIYHYILITRMIALVKSSTFFFSGLSTAGSDMLQAVDLPASYHQRRSEMMDGSSTATSFFSLGGNGDT